MGSIEFTDNYQDVSTEAGFQFRFHCERCGDGFLSRFEANTAGVVGSIVRAAGGFFGGLLGRASSSTYEVERAIGGAARDAALGRAVAEIRWSFQKCPRCADWVCAQTCWNEAAQACKRCAPAAAEPAAIDARCPACDAPTLGKKFCPSCGKPVGASACAACGAQLTPGARFCGDCGKQQ